MFLRGLFFSYKKKLIYLYFRYKSHGLLKKPREEQIFVLGHQKSGTSAIAGLLSEMAGLSLTNDIHRGNRDHDIYRQAHFHKKGQIALISKYAYELSREIVKEPELSFFYSTLKEFNPKAKFIYISRQPKYIIKSILSRLGARESSNQIYAENFYKQINLAPLWKDITGFSSGVNIISHLAYRIEKLDKLFLENKDEIILLRYEDFVSEKSKVLKEALVDLGMNNKNEVDHLLDHPFQPKGTNVLPSEYFSIEEVKLIESICKSSEIIYS